MFGVTYALMWLLCVCNKLNQNIIGLDFNLYTITPGLALFIHLFLSLIMNVDLSPYSTRNHICVGYPMQMKLTQKMWNLHGQNKLQHERTQHKLCSTCSCWGLTLEVLGFAMSARGGQGPNVNERAFWLIIGIPA